MLDKLLLITLRQAAVQKYISCANKANYQRHGTWELKQKTTTTTTKHECTRAEQKKIKRKTGEGKILLSSSSSAQKANIPRCACCSRISLCSNMGSTAHQPPGKPCVCLPARALKQGSYRKHWSFARLGGHCYHSLPLYASA